MKVLIVNTADVNGGAARAAFRLHQALLARDVESQMLVQNRGSDLPSVIGPKSRLQKIRALVNGILDTVFLRGYRNKSGALFSPSKAPSGTTVDRINDLNADIVHLHWVNGGMLRVEDIPRIKAPVVWSLHDMWAFTGGCHYDEHCGRFANSCGQCPVLGSSNVKDLSAQVLNRKLKAFEKKKQLAIVGLSRWLADSASRSALFHNREVVNLPNPIDTSKFRPFNQRMARELLSLPADKKLVLFGAMGATSDPRKGFPELSRALKNLACDNVELVVFGSSGPTESQGFPQRTHYLGQLFDDVTLRALYSAADVLVVPSRQENLSNAIMEALACGTPVVAFDIGGNSDMVDHQLSGYLARGGEVDDLAHGIRWVLDHPDSGQLAEHAVQTVQDRFDSRTVADKYINLYTDILSR